MSGPTIGENCSVWFSTADIEKMGYKFHSEWNSSVGVQIISRKGILPPEIVRKILENAAQSKPTYIEKVNIFFKAQPASAVSGQWQKVILIAPERKEQKQHCTI